MITLRNTVALLFALATAAAPATAETVLRLSNWVPPSHVISRDILTPWAEDVARVTEGRVRIDILKTALGKPPAHYDIARDGLADITVGVHGYTPGRFVLTQIAELPFLSDSAEALSVAYWRIHERYLASHGEHRGVQLLGLWTHGPGHIFNARRDIYAVADLDGLKFRVGGASVSRISDALGTVGVPAPATRAYELLSNGVADGIYFPTESIEFFNLTPFMRHGTLIPGGLYNASFFLVANEDSWRDIDAADREAILAVSGEVLAKRAGMAWDASDQAAMEALTAAGTALTVAETPMIQELQYRLAFAEADWVANASDAGADAALALAALRTEIEAYR
ncbi:MAG: TRAP transporter substrate-binding protein, partial [Alphaproteobacteria bacterium]|jgi:TRAP-type C4-dicarboxylate transport system substrate-binding protein|nr:TRAP transporter substrate-binding protein [Alphaproteobacteria bacterium]